MDKFIINGPMKLKGEVEVSSAKNAALPIMAACLLNPHKIEITDMPQLRDVLTMKKILSNLGVKIDQKKEITTFDSSNISSYKAPYEYVKTMRASICVLGPLLARFKEAIVSLPGGCSIGARPVDLHIKGLKMMGANIELKNGYVIAKTEGLKGTEITLPFPSVGATENLMMAAVLADGETSIENAAKEPEVVDLACFLNAMGAKISGIGTEVLKIEGVKELRPLDTPYRVIGDRIEAATYIIMGLVTKSKIKVKGFNTEHIKETLEILEEMGAKFKKTHDSITIEECNDLVPTHVRTGPYPEFPTDIQAQLMALCTTIEGQSVIQETIFENRFMHVPELNRMGAKISLQGNKAFIDGSDKLRGAQVMCTDLRASAALVVSALVANGESEIYRVYHIDRGYEQIDLKLKKLGANIKRLNTGD